ncbi:MAG TPA: ribosome biogenesis GTP-binding protein YihA/YsxC [Flavobacteriaceae bacterium]|nr:ribosome biogenesis GTP-binding protein YihA/YsxC [Flavobacteriaceae bacterium]
MKIQSSEFYTSSARVSECPDNNLPEFAFIGRSNVGKSSLINSLCNKKSIAKTSSKPGKTLLINHFIINKSFFIVDLPGYGFAKVSKKEKEKIKNIHENYFKNRKQLFSALLLIDIRLEPQKIDLEFMEYINKLFVPFILIFTKSDKLKKSEASKRIQTYSEEIKRNWEKSPQIIISSAKNKIGLDDILIFINKSIQEFKKN